MTICYPSSNHGPEPGRQESNLIPRVSGRSRRVQREGGLGPWQTASKGLSAWGKSKLPALSGDQKRRALRKTRIPAYSVRFSQKSAVVFFRHWDAELKPTDFDRDQIPI